MPVDQLHHSRAGVPHRPRDHQRVLPRLLEPARKRAPQIDPPLALLDSLMREQLRARMEQRRITLSTELLALTKSYPLSRLWMMGHLGAVPNV